MIQKLKRETLEAIESYSFAVAGHVFEMMEDYNGEIYDKARMRRSEAYENLLEAISKEKDDQDNHLYIIYGNLEGVDTYSVEGTDYLAKLNNLIAENEDEDGYDAYLLVIKYGIPMHVEKIYGDVDLMEE